MIARILLSVLILPLLTGSAHGQDAKTSNDPVENFEFAWQTLDRTYAFFYDKQLDWDAIYHVYRPQVTSDTTPAELFTVLLRMIGHLHDGHVAIDRKDGKGQVHAEETDWSRYGEDFSLKLIISKYLRGKYSQDLNDSLTSGWLTKEIAYLHIQDLKQGKQATPKALDAIIKRLSDANGFVVDVRCHLGGNGNTAKFCANRFADRKRHYMQTRTRYGKGHDDFAPLTYKYVQPDGPIQFTRPTIVLTHRFTESAGEDFAMAMDVLPHATIVGEQTAGALGSQYAAPMPNGWILWTPFIANLDHRGVCWNGIGLAPDMYIVNSRTDIELGKDRVLEFAMQLLQRSKLKPQNEASSVENLKTSMVETFDRIVGQKGLEAAIAEINRMRASGADEYFLSPDEIAVQSQQYMARGRFEEAIALLQVCVDESPQFAGGYGMLAYCMVKTDDIEAAKAMVAKAESTEMMYAFESAHLELAKRELKKYP